MCYENRTNPLASDTTTRVPDFQLSGGLNALQTDDAGAPNQPAADRLDHQ